MARRYVLTGRVQGVGFRYFVEGAAVREGLDGWVRNTPDGRVEIAAEGAQDAIERFEGIIRQGPRAARVDHVEVESGTPTGANTGFTIRS